jgi:hypothetical protein
MDSMISYIKYNLIRIVQGECLLSHEAKITLITNTDTDYKKSKP